MTKKIYFQFEITKWDESGNVLLEKHTMDVQRQTLESAKNVVYRKYQIKRGYFIELKLKTIK